MNGFELKNKNLQSDIPESCSCFAHLVYRTNPSDDLSKIRRISLVVIPQVFPKHILSNAHMRKCSLRSGTRDGCFEKSLLVSSKGMQTHLHGLQVTATKMAGKETVPDIQG